jgi:SpoVK/Ycf46/Vps4 family AAA+-type ATPase
MSGFTINDIKSVLREGLEYEPITKESLQSVLKQINPSGIKDLLMDIPSVKWTDIGGYENVKDEIRRVIEWPLKHPEAFQHLGVQPSKGILLYGPPGCCKTLLARAICTKCNLAFMAVKGPELFSKYVGDSEKAIRDIFRKARMCAPCVIFFDEIDAIAPQRSNSTDVADRVLIQLLTEMDGFDTLKNVIIVAATNRPSAIDKALLRPGRYSSSATLDSTT